MNVRMILLFFMTLMFPGMSSAICQQHAIVFYENGVETTKPNARDSMFLLRDEVLKSPGVSVDCVDFTYAYNTKEPLLLDLVEAGAQKTKELALDIREFWKKFFRIVPYAPTAWYDSLIDNWYAQAVIPLNVTEFILGNQVAEHLAAYRDQFLLDRLVILVPHSQGALYANTEWGQMTSEEQIRTHIVAIASPSDDVADGGPHTTLEEDGISGLFPFALPANASNGNDCTLLGNWYCHAFKESYLTGKNSRDKIIGDIVAFLPEQPPEQLTGSVQGTVYDLDGLPVVNAIVRLILTDSGDTVQMAHTDGFGHYLFTDVQPCDCALSANRGYYWGGSPIEIKGGSDDTVDIVLSTGIFPI